MAIFTPFDNSVWVLYAVTIFVCTIALRIVERPGALSTHTLKSTSEAIQYAGDILQGMYDMIMSFLGGEDAVLDTARSWPSRIISFGIGIFVFIHVNSYTGSLAAYYVSNNAVQLGNVTGLADIKVKGGNLCVYASMAAATMPIISSVLPASRIVQMDRYGTMLEKLIKGNCSAAVVGKFESLTYIGASNVNFSVCNDPADPNNYAACANSSYPSTPILLNPKTCGSSCQYASRFCSLIPLQDDTIASITLAWELPVSGFLEPWVSYAMMRIHTAGNLSLYQAREILSRNPVVCSPPGPPSNSIGLDGLAGTFVICGGVIVVALVVHLVYVATYLARRPAAPRAGAKPPSHGGLNGHGAEEAGLRDGADGAAGKHGEAWGDEEGAEDRPLTEALAEIERILRKAQKL